MSERIKMRLVHESPGRLRLRTAQGALEPTFLRALGQQIASEQAVQEVRTSVRTGSVLVLHEGACELILASLQGTVELEPRAPRAPMSRLQRALGESERRLARRTRGLMTPGALAFAASLAGAAWQVRNGHWLPPALSMLELALKALQHEAEREQAGAV